MRGVAGPRFSMSSYRTSLLCTVSWFMYSGKRSQSQALAHLDLPGESSSVSRDPATPPVPKPKSNSGQADSL